MWAQDTNGQFERCNLVVRSVIQADPFAFNGCGVDGDVAGNLRKVAPVDGFGDSSTAAVDGSDWSG